MPCKFAETRVPTELGRARSSRYTELRSQISQFKMLSVARTKRCTALTVSFADFPDAAFNEMLRLQRLYHREARKCKTAKAYLAGCVMLGVALEAVLVAMVHCVPDEAAHADGVPRIKDEIEQLVAWRLVELLRVAKNLGWLPSRLQLSGAWDHKRAHIGDHAEVVRMLRNLVHPASYLSEHSGERITPKHLAHAFEVLEVVHDHLHHRLIKALRETIEAQNGA